MACRLPLGMTTIIGTGFLSAYRLSRMVSAAPSFTQLVSSDAAAVQEIQDRVLLVL